MNLTNHFLIAMPAMDDPNFSRTVVYLCEHGEQGALGLVVNRPMDLTLGGLLERIDISTGAEGLEQKPVYAGGPVQTDRGFVLHRPLGSWQSTLHVVGEIGLTSSRDILQAVGGDNQPNDMLVTLGYSGWGAGQLEHEIAQNAWLTVDARADILFDTPPRERLTAAMSLLGVNFASLSEEAGHA